MARIDFERIRSEYRGLSDRGSRVLFAQRVEAVTDGLWEDLGLAESLAQGMMEGGAPQPLGLQRDFEDSIQLFGCRPPRGCRKLPIC